MEKVNIQQLLLGGTIDVAVLTKCQNCDGKGTTPLSRCGANSKIVTFHEPCRRCSGRGKDVAPISLQDLVIAIKGML